MSNAPITLLLIEDDIYECEKFKNHINHRTDVNLIAITNSDIEGLKLIKQHKPDAVILDIELHKGSGNATSFNLLEELSHLKLSKKPKIIVNTVVSSNSVYDYLHDKGVDLIFYKKQANYSIENIINTIILLSGYTNTSFIENATITDNNIKIEEKISQLITEELNLIGIGLHLQGRKYLYDAIYYLIINENDLEKATPVQYLVNKYKRSASTISRAMQNAILHAWRVSNLEDLETYYTARINYETGVPTPTEFIYYYCDKIKKEI